MNRKNKLLNKFFESPIKSDITFQELDTLMNLLGCKKLEGKGSRERFSSPVFDEYLHIHKPHPHNTLHKYQIKIIQQFIKKLL